MSKKQTVKILFILNLTLICVSCAGVKNLSQGKIIAEPEYQLSAIRFIEIDMEQLALEIDLQVSNPNYLALVFKNINYQLQLNDSLVLEGVLPNELNIPAKGEALVTIPMRIQLDRFSEGALSLMMSRQVSYIFQAKLNSAVPILDKKTFTVKKVELLTF
jgi:LEA14-like dessication related protein